MLKPDEENTEVEELLNRYRPGPPTLSWDQISKFPNPQVSKSTWPWAVAAAALLAITVGLHGAVVPAPDPASVAAAQRVKAIAEELGGTPGSEVMAEWMVRREARVEREARASRATAPEFERQ